MTERNTLPIDETLSAMKAGHRVLGRSAEVVRLKADQWIITPTNGRVIDHIAKNFRAKHRNAKVQQVGRGTIVAKTKADAVRTLKRIADLHAHATK